MKQTLNKPFKPIPLDEYKALSPEQQDVHLGDAVAALHNRAGPTFTVNLLISGQALAVVMRGAVKAGTLTEAQAESLTRDYATAYIDAFKRASDVARDVISGKGAR